jgi:hypothetical protein
MLQISQFRNDSNRLADKHWRQEISATLTGDDHCECEEFDASATANTPVLALCRQLLAQGVDPDRALAVYRRGVLALKVRSIRTGARLTVKTAGNGTPIFAPDGVQGGAAAPPMRSQPGIGPEEGVRP